MFLLFLIGYGLVAACSCLSRSDGVEPVISGIGKLW